MEATGHYWPSAYGSLLEHGFEVKVINPIQSEAFRKMYIRQTKNDRKDSFIIAQIVRFGQFFVTNLSLVFRHLWRCLLGAIILSEIGDIHRFDASNKLVAFAGLDVRVTQSGEFIGTRQKISKRGSPYLRRAIWLSASKAAFCAPILSEYYQSLRARGKHHLTAIGTISRKLCNTIYAIFKEDRPLAAGIS